MQVFHFKLNSWVCVIGHSQVSFLGNKSASSCPFSFWLLDTFLSTSRRWEMCCFCSSASALSNLNTPLLIGSQPVDQDSQVGLELLSRGRQVVVEIKINSKNKLLLVYIAHYIRLSLFWRVAFFILFWNILRTVDINANKKNKHKVMGQSVNQGKCAYFRIKRSSIYEGFVHFVTLRLLWVKSPSECEAGLNTNLIFSRGHDSKMF